ncbi:MAG: Rrf2 family transcriptional regulator [Candidatus Hydrogenedentes bacterium]|nr:Rrf2 family transcriptional regulator [Candidatus Hydrogenedentota bacterium]
MLTATSEYALRALVKLAQLPGEEMIFGQTLSTQCRIPANYLSKLMLVLRNSGLVEAVRGSHGGYRLGKPAREICIVDVVSLFENVKSETKCLLGEDHDCSDVEACSAHVKYRRVRLAYIDFLTTTTIASIAKKKPLKKK